ncbi:transposase [Streptomyces sp. NBC_00154]|uniref:transposase n=1 Tax=Streptomyces sp. NBC_00154 TaxID=2975670 RepID=UPI002257A8F6|nr:transposase [Streptomyces sp. NBC_00154]MCX5315674.1 transposase [Streptomyces sp. NBC_00154]
MGDAVGRHDLTDEAWAVVEALLPVAGCGRPARNLRRQVDGIRHRARPGCPWRDVPALPGWKDGGLRWGGHVRRSRSSTRTVRCRSTGIHPTGSGRCYG